MLCIQIITNMKRSHMRLFGLALATLCLAPTNTFAQKTFDRMKSPTSLSAPTEGEMDVILLDSIIGEDERYYYEYNELGYLISTRMYTSETDEYGSTAWVFDNDEDVSLLSEYTFDLSNRCTRYSEYTFDANEKKDKEVRRIETTYSGETRTEKYYLYREETDAYAINALVLEQETTYDKFGNPSITKEYTYDGDGEMKLDEYEERRFTSSILSYEDCENGNYEPSIDETLYEKYCYYKVTYDSYCLSGWKFETDENGKKIRYKIYEENFDISRIDDIDALWELDEEYPDTENSESEDIEIAAANATSSANYETGFNDIDFTEGDWHYHGGVEIEDVYNEDTESYEKKITGGKLSIIWQGNGDYYYTHPLNNYQFPRGVLNYANYYAMNHKLDIIHAFWDSGEERWVLETAGGNTYAKHYKDDKGNIVVEHSKFQFIQETARMEIVAGSTRHTTYSFDEQGRLSTIDNGHRKTCFEYLNDTNYLKKEYSIDNNGNKSNIFDLYYSNGKYQWPITNATGIEETIEADLWVDGNRIIAEGEITVYNTCGQLAARGKNCVAVENNGIYIVKTEGATKKICIK